VGWCARSCILVQARQLLLIGTMCWILAASQGQRGGFIPRGGGFMPIGGGFMPIGDGFMPRGGGSMPRGGGLWPEGVDSCPDPFSWLQPRTLKRAGMPNESTSIFVGYTPNVPDKW
jgi:hypothetical protein